MRTCWPRSAASSTALRLAIELAAVRVGVYGLREVAALLDGRLKLEWRGRRTAPPRHQTLGATLDWSYGLIDESERACFGVSPSSPARSRCRARWQSRAMSVSRPIKSSMRLGSSSPSRWFRRGRMVPRRRYRLLDTTNAYAMQKLVGCRRSAGDRPPACRLCSAACLKQPWPRSGRRRSGISLAGAREPARRCPCRVELESMPTTTVPTCACRWPALRQAVCRAQSAERGAYLVAVARSRPSMTRTAAARGSSSCSRRWATPSCSRSATASRPRARSGAVLRSLKLSTTCPISSGCWHG